LADKAVRGQDGSRTPSCFSGPFFPSKNGLFKQAFSLYQINGVFPVRLREKFCSDRYDRLSKKEDDR
jgi:hypothetical protein